MSGSEKWRDHGLLVIRLGMGVMFVMHGWPKMAGGAKAWAKLGGAMKHLGVDFAPTLWGFAGAASELGGGVLLALGLLYRPACTLLMATMAVAVSMHLGQGDGLVGASHALEAGIVFAGLLLTGPGRFALDARLGRG